MHASDLSGPMPGLPDPDLDAQFYEGVPLRRFAAWLVDLAIVLVVGVPLAFFRPPDPRLRLRALSGDRRRHRASSTAS